MTSARDHVDLVRRCPLFATAGEDSLARILPHSTVLRRPRSTVLFEQHQDPSDLHLLLRGSIGLRAKSESGDETIVEIFTAGELLLAPAAILRLPYLASGVALTDVLVLLVPTDVFLKAMDQDPPLMRAVVQMLSRHWRLMVEQVVDLKLRSAEDRVARFLARRVSTETDAGPADLPESRIAIAARLGMTPETLSRTLAGLEAKGMIRMSHRRADVLDRAALWSVSAERGR